MTHDELVDIAVRWACKKTGSGGGCTYVYAELYTAARSIPDVIGWRHGTSLLVEVKRTRSDFLRDQKKSARRHYPIGNHRYYFTPTGLVKKEEVPEGWGLLELSRAGRVSVSVEAPFHEHTQRSAQQEMLFLSSVIRRLEKRQTFDRRRRRFITKR